MVTAVYVSNADSRDIAVLAFNADTHALTLRQTLPLPGAVMPMALAPDRRHLYAALRSEPFGVASMAIHPTNGRLTLQAISPLPQSMANIATDRSGRHLFAVSYGADCLSLGPIGADGVAGAATLVLPTGRNAHAAVVDPSNNFLFVATLGSDAVMQWHFGAASGSLAPNTPALFQARAGSGPRHLAFHPNGRFVYLLGELDAGIDVLAFDAHSGQLTALQTLPTLPPGFAGKPWAADVHLTPDGRWLVTCERTSSTLAVFAVDPAHGTLALRGHFATETQPRSFAFDPTGRFLFVAGQLSHHLSVCTVDADSGALATVARAEVGRNPNWIETLALA
jgi:6-phosphogluconolactonase